MLSTFSGDFDVPHQKKENKVVPAMVDLYNQNMGGVDSSDQVMYSYAFERKSKSWSKKVVFNLLTRLLMNSYILYKLTVAHPKTRLEFIKMSLTHWPLIIKKLRQSVFLEIKILEIYLGKKKKTA